MNKVLICKHGNFIDSYIDYRDLEYMGWFYLHFESGKVFYRHITLNGVYEYAERT